MNQILYEDVQTKSTDIKKVIKFFAIAIIIFGIALTAGGVYGFFKNQSNNSELDNQTKPVIYVNKNEDDATIQMQVNHDKEISKITYSWNNGDQTIIQGNKRNNISETIDWPAGENELNIEVIDVNGVKANYKQTYLLNYGIDIEKPTIKLEPTSNNNLIITATDEQEIVYITYRWNEEEEISVDATDASKTIIKTTIPIKKGENTLTVIAVDSNNNETTEEKVFVAYTKPDIKVRQFGKKLQITVTDEIGIESIKYSLNGEEHTWNATTSKTEWEEIVNLEEGQTKVIINATNVKEIANEFKGICEYKP